MEYVCAQWFVIEADTLHQLGELMNKHNISQVAKVELILGIYYQALVFGFKPTTLL